MKDDNYYNLIERVAEYFKASDDDTIKISQFEEKKKDFLSYFEALMTKEKEAVIKRDRAMRRFYFEPYHKRKTQKY